jgi:hypothetical protein
MTIKPYESLQEVFNAAYLGMAKQDWQPAWENGNCVYLSPSDGKRCAIGHAIPQEILDHMPNIGTIDTVLRKPKLIEGSEAKKWHFDGEMSFRGEIVWLDSQKKIDSFNALKLLFSKLNMENIKDLQYCHDDPAINNKHAHTPNSPETLGATIKRNFESFAHGHGLTIPVVTA